MCEECRGCVRSVGDVERQWDGDVWGVEKVEYGVLCPCVLVISGIPVPMTIDTSSKYCVRLGDLWMLFIID